VRVGDRRAGGDGAVDDGVPVRRDMPGAEHMPSGIRNDRRWGFSTSGSASLPRHTITHIDSPCHIFWDGMMYNGRSHSLVDAATGSAWAAVTAAANGIITRGVLLDIAGSACAVVGTRAGCFPDDLEEAERRQGVRCDPAMRYSCDWLWPVRHEGGEASVFTQTGWHASCLPWLHERGVALIGADTPQEVQPSGYDDVLMPVHAVSLAAMVCGCSTTATWRCARRRLPSSASGTSLAVGRSRFAGTSGSPVNPIATF